MTATCRVSSRAYYSTYHGHSTQLLRPVLDALRGPGLQRRQAIFFAGDSSLDNKYWFPDSAPAVNGYEGVLDPAEMKEDVCYCVNRELVSRRLGSHAFAINTAVEATTLGERSSWYGGLNGQDRFIQENLAQGDSLVVSVGGNDIALAPSLATIASMLSLVYLASDESLEQGTATGMGHFIHMFRDQLQSYVSQLVQRCKPRKILLCMIYYPGVDGEGSWADFALSAMSYNMNPERLQLAIRSVFRLAVSQVRIEGVEVVPVPLFEALDGTISEDYVERVEPSPAGGRKMAHLLVDKLGLGALQ